MYGADVVRAMQKKMGRIALAPDVWRLLQSEYERAGGAVRCKQ